MMFWVRVFYILTIGLSLLFHGLFLLVYTQVGYMIAWAPVLKFIFPLAVLVVIAVSLLVAMMRGALPLGSIIGYFIGAAGLQGYMYWVTTVQSGQSGDLSLGIRLGIPLLLLVPAAVALIRKKAGGVAASPSGR